MKQMNQEKMIYNVLLGFKPQHILILPHVRTDPDALGAVTGLASLLSQLGHSVEIYVDEEIDPKLAFIHQEIKPSVFDEAKLDDIKEPNLLIYLDHHSQERLNNRKLLIDKYPEKDILIIDHHLVEAENEKEFLQQAEFKDRQVFAWIDPSRSSVSEMIGELFLRFLDNKPDQISLNKSTAIGLLAGIYGDTGGLRFSNTTAQTFYICSRLMREDIAIDKMTSLLFGNKSLDQIRLKSKIFENAKVNDRGNIIWYGVTRDFLKENKGNDDDLEGLASELRECENIDLALLFREDKHGEIRVNLRSNENFDASLLARKFGGGGHARAAGISFKDNDDLDQVMRMVVSQAESMMNNI